MFKDDGSIYKTLKPGSPMYNSQSSVVNTVFVNEDLLDCRHASTPVSRLQQSQIAAAQQAQPTEPMVFISTTFSRKLC